MNLICAFRGAGLIAGNMFVQDPFGLSFLDFSIGGRSEIEMRAQWLEECEMAAKLVAYGFVPLGFEIAIDNTDVEMGKAWNLWHNVKLTDNPEAWDSEITSINKMQSELGELHVNQRLVRAQMAEFCRVCPVFPKSIEVLCEEIGLDRFSKPLRIGCEGRGLLECLGYHDYRSLGEQLQEVLAEYVRSLEKWQEGGQPETATESKVFGFLGQPNRIKLASARKLVDLVDSGDRSASSYRKLAERVCNETQKDFLSSSLGERYASRPFNCFKCLSEDTSTPECQCCYSLFLDACLLCAGTSHEERSMLDEFRRFVEENILAYSWAINSWLTRARAKYVAWPRGMRYVSRKRALRIAENLHSLLGERNMVKEWLTACLLKTIRDNQRWHKRTELTDHFPEAASWLRQMP